MNKGFTPTPAPPGLTRRAALQATTAVAAGAAPCALAQAGAKKDAKEVAPTTLQIVGPWEFTSLSPASSGYMVGPAKPLQPA